MYCIWKKKHYCQIWHTPPIKVDFCYFVWKQWLKNNPCLYLDFTSLEEQGHSKWAKVWWTFSKLQRSEFLPDMELGVGPPWLLSTFTWVTFWVSFSPTCVLACKITQSTWFQRSHLSLVCHSILLSITDFSDLQKMWRVLHPRDSADITAMVRTSAELQHFYFMNSKNLKHNYPNKSF